LHCLQRTDHIIAISQFIKDNLGQLKINPDKISVVYNLPPINPILKKTSSHQENKTLQILACGRLTQDKGFDILLKALASQKNKDYRLTLVGSGPYQSSLDKICVNLKLTNKVKMVARVNPEQMSQFYERADLVVVPSLFPEPFGRVALEALSYSKPVIASRIGGLPEIVKDKLTGMLIEPGDTHALAQALTKLLADRTLCVKMGVVGRQDILARFNPHKILSQLIKIYQNIMPQEKSVITKEFLRTYYEKEGIRTSREEEMYANKDPYQTYWHQRLHTEIKQAFTKTPGTSFLEVGCAEGYYIKLYSEIYPQVKLCGLDLAESYLKKARNNVPEAQFVQGDAEALPFKNNAYDVVLCSETLEHVPDPKRAFSELARVAKKQIIIAIPGHTVFYQILKHLKLIRASGNQDAFQELGGGHLNDLNLQIIKKWALAQDFKVLYEKVDCFFPPGIAAKMHLPLKWLQRLDNISSKLPLVHNLGLVQVLILSKNKTNK
jgi:ubiquinone/menaquinone biosynthesis C-methylase UbiE